MSTLSQGLSEIKGGLSEKKVFRKQEKNYNKIIIDFSKNANEFNNFLDVYRILLKTNISIPKIYEVNLEKNLILMEDFGDNSFDKIFDQNNLYDLLKLAVDNLIIIQNFINTEDLENLEKYSYIKLNEEISEFVDYYLPYKNNVNFQVKDFFRIWEKVYNAQNFNFNSFVHKDFEFINLIFLNKNKSHLKCGIIDFQSAFIGFKGWDLFSILENSRFNFTRKYNEHLIKYFYNNINFGADFNTFRKQYYILNLARQTRLLGRWVKLFNEGYKNYLTYIGPTKNRIIASLKNVDDDKLKRIYETILTI